ncbi:hypothetical protein EVAR_78044_1 [Eumeta japonica]|uniref:Uncharacterized protein n=1 Tax=Eumeta variegata TaxID=151549 RepID=A0A4C1T068_EUMVA|nr:hypothetical protein EVAR_78044_1 [Eumeta japonica]
MKTWPNDFVLSALQQLRTELEFFLGALSKITIVSYFQLTCCALFAAVTLCSAAPPERHPPAEQEQVADVYDAIFIVPRPDLASLGPANSYTSTDGTGFGGSGGFSFNLFGIKSASVGAGGFGKGVHTASADTDAASGSPVYSDYLEEDHNYKSIY